MKRPLPAPNTLQPGHYIFWQQRTYQVVARVPDNALLLHAQPYPEGPQTTLSLLDLLATPRTSPLAPLFAPTVESLQQQIEERYGHMLGTITHDLPDSYVIKARIVTSVVETVRRLVESDEQRAKAHGEKMSREQAIRRALLVVNKTTIRMQVRGTTQVLHSSILSTPVCYITMGTPESRKHVSTGWLKIFSNNEREDTGSIQSAVGQPFQRIW